MEMGGQLQAPYHQVTRIVNTDESYVFRCRLICQFLCRGLLGLSAGTHSPLCSRADRKAVTLNCRVSWPVACYVRLERPEAPQTPAE